MPQSPSVVPQRRSDVVTPERHPHAASVSTFASPLAESTPAGLQGLPGTFISPVAALSRRVLRTQSARKGRRDSFPRGLTGPPTAHSPLSRTRASPVTAHALTPTPRGSQFAGDPLDDAMRALAAYVASPPHDDRSAGASADSVLHSSAEVQVVGRRAVEAEMLLLRHAHSRQAGVGLSVAELVVDLQRDLQV